MIHHLTHSRQAPPPLPRLSPFHIGQRLFTGGGSFMGEVIRVEFDKKNNEYRASIEGGFLTESEVNHHRFGQIGRRSFAHPAASVEACEWGDY